MSLLIRQYDWATTPVGPIDRWSASLRTLVRMMLTSRFPSLIFWGPELTTFYNDAFRPSLGNEGKHPGSLGQPGAVSWAESWPVIGPMIQDIMAGGEAVWFEDQKLPLYREGQMGYAYWTYCFSPLTDESNAISGVLVTCTETTQTVESIDQLQRTNAQLHHLIEQNQVLHQEEQAAQQAIQNAVDLAELATWHVDVLGGEVTYSPRFNEWMGLGQQTNIIHAFDAVVAEEAAHIKEAYRQAISLASTGRLDVEFAVANINSGTSRRIHVVGQTQRDEQGRAVSIGGFAQDVTQLRATQLTLETQVRERTQELVAANQGLLRSNDNLQQFAYVASHDLQEHLRKIQQFGNLLQLRQSEQALDAESAGYIERMQVAAARMSTLIRDILTYSRLDIRPGASEAVSLLEIINEVQTSLELTLSETGAVLTVGDLPTIQGDFVQLGQLFQNLLSNALKFRQAARRSVIQVQSQLMLVDQLPMTVQPSRPALAYYRIDVIDNGIGFDEKYADRIFQVFQRLHGKGEYAGTGIGLSICQRVAANHGGAITVHSQPGQGSTFSVYLPT